MKNIKLIFKNLRYLIKTRKVFFTLMCMGQIVSLCVVLVLTGVVQINLSEKNLEWYSDLSKFEVYFNDEDNIMINKCINAASELEKFIGDDFYYLGMEGNIGDEENYVESLYPGKCMKGDVDSRNTFTYEQYMSDEKIVLYSLYYEKTEDDYYDYGGEKYKIVGKVNYIMPCIPMYALSDNVKIKTVQLCIKGIISNSRVEKISDKIKEVFDTNAEIQRPKGIDLLGIQGNNMVTMSTVLSVVLLAFNSFVCYYYIFDKRRNWLIVTRITGCTKRKAMNMYMGEMLIILIFNLLIGLLIFTQVIYPFMVHRKSFYSEIYDVRTYVLCAAIFVLFSMAISYIGVISTLGKSVMDLKKK